MAQNNLSTDQVYFMYKHINVYILYYILGLLHIRFIIMLMIQCLQSSEQFDTNGTTYYWVSVNTNMFPTICTTIITSHTY